MLQKLKYTAEELLLISDLKEKYKDYMYKKNGKTIFLKPVPQILKDFIEEQEKSVEDLNKIFE